MSDSAGTVIVDCVDGLAQRCLLKSSISTMTMLCRMAADCAFKASNSEGVLGRDAADETASLPVR